MDGQFNQQTTMRELARSRLLGRNRQRGFSLIEIALVLVIVGLALGGIMAAFGPQMERKQVTDTQDRMKQASEAIVAFALVNRRLPCPATAASNGAEVTGARGICTNPNNGFVPAATLGLGDRAPNGLTQDAWVGGLRYAVSQVAYNGTANYSTLGCAPGVPTTCYPLTQVDGVKNAFYNAGTQVNPNAGPPTLQLTGLQTLRICNSATGITATTCGPAANDLATAAFIVWSTGRDGTVAGGVDEAANLNNDVVYVFHPRAESGAVNGEFDHLLLWQTVSSIVSKMSDGGVLK